MKKIFVLDTNVILSDYMSIYAFEDNVVVLPSTVLEEVDSKKDRTDGVGLNARAFSREIDNLRKIAPLHKGVPLPNGGTLVTDIVPSASSVYDFFMEKTPDNAILALAWQIGGREESPVILVSKDVNMRVKADTVGLVAQDYMNDKVLTSADDKYKGFREIETDSDSINTFYSEKSLPMDGFNENEFIILKHSRQSALGRVYGGFMRPLYNYTGQLVWGLTARNAGQRMALDLLLDPNIPLVTITGKAGTGKTLLALAAALQQTLDAKRYRNVLVARPVVPMGNDIGYLPGEMEEKLRPWMQPIYDNLEFLFNCKNESDLDKILAGMCELKVEALTYIRGRSIPEQFIIIDEAQNLTKHEIKTILTRVGEGSKIVLIGDPEQIDHPYLDQFSNGLTYVVETMKEQKLAGHVHLEKGERSALAQLCADML